MSFENPEILIKNILEFSVVKRREDLLTIITLISTENKTKFEDLIFKAKYVRGLMRIFKQSSNNPAFNQSVLKKELADNIKDITELLKGITRKADDKIMIHFESTYYAATPANLANLYELIGDLEVTKKYFNSLR